MKISYHYNNDLKNNIKYITQILETYSSTRRIHNVLDILTNSWGLITSIIKDVYSLLQVCLAFHNRSFAFVFRRHLKELLVYTLHYAQNGLQ